MGMNLFQGEHHEECTTVRLLHWLLTRFPFTAKEYRWSFMDLFLNYVKYLLCRSKKYETKLTMAQTGGKMG